MTTTPYEYEVVLRVVHHETPNPDEPSLNPRTLAEGIAVKAEHLMDYIEVTVKDARLVGVVR